MSTSGSLAQKPAAKPPGSSTGAHGCHPGSGGPACRLANRPRRSATPLPATSASAVNSPTPTRSWTPPGSSAGARRGPIIAEATAEVVADVQPDLRQFRPWRVRPGR